MSLIRTFTDNEVDSSGKTRRAAPVPVSLRSHQDSDLITQIQIAFLTNLEKTHTIGDHYDKAIEVIFFNNTGDVAVRVPDIFLSGVIEDFWKITFKHVVLGDQVVLEFIDKELIEKGDRSEAKTFLGGNAQHAANTLSIAEIISEVSAKFKSIGLRTTVIRKGREANSLYIEYELTQEAYDADHPPRYQLLKNITLSDNGKVYFKFFAAWFQNVKACEQCFTPFNRFGFKNCACTAPGGSSSSDKLTPIQRMRKRLKK